MNEEELENVIENEDLYIDLEDFYPKAFTFASHRRKRSRVSEGNPLYRICFEEYDELSKRLDKTPFQESTAVRNVLKARRLATLLIDDKGDMDYDKVVHAKELIQSTLYSLGPDRQHDAVRNQHILNVLSLLTTKVELVRLLKSIDKPVSHKYADQIIRDTLSLSHNTPITDAHARRAALSAWLCTLRQSVGSCFATAPAIIIQAEQPTQFLTDIRDLLNTGRLKRTFGGNEYVVPLSKSWGAGDLKKPFIIYTGEGFEKSGLWLSPGFSAAFETMGLLDIKDTAISKISKVKEMLETLFVKGISLVEPVITSADEIIKTLLKRHLGITDKDLEDYQNRSVGMIHGGVFFQPTVSALSNLHSGKHKPKTKNELCALYYEKLTLGGDALKSLSDNALLKAWEFSVASFAETKATFTSWNLYSSLGLGAHEHGGIGLKMYEIIKEKLDRANARVQEFQAEYETAYAQIKMMESRINSVSSEREAQWLKAEYQSKRNEFYTFEEMRDKINRKAHQLASLYEFLIDKYYELFPKYFQEVYDADMQDITAGQYDDNPAGFRLLYKYGRTNTSQWTYIHTPHEFIEALVSFFTATEIEIVSDDAVAGLQQDLSDIVTNIVSLVRTKEFLESAFHRMAAVHHTRAIKDPLDHLDQIDKKPWAYTSGGTMDTLVSCYFRLEQKPAEIGRWVENPTELLTFIVDTLKQMPSKALQEYFKEQSRSLLIHSPTHAFLLKPGFTLFSKALQNDALTYIWIRDHYILPQKEYLESLWLDEEKTTFLVHKLSEKLPQEYRHDFINSLGRLPGNLRPREFRERVVDHLKRGLKQFISLDDIDSLLFQLLPLVSRDHLREAIEGIFREIPALNQEFILILMKIYEMVSQPKAQRRYFDSQELQQICKGLLCLAFEDTSLPIDFHREVHRAAQKLGYALPAPVIFADTNWVKEFFAFVVNPGTSQLELWRVDCLASQGTPMSTWKRWLDGSNRERTWGIYIKPHEYS